MNIFSTRGGLDLTGVSEEELAAMPDDKRTLFDALATAVESEQKLNAEPSKRRTTISILSRAIWTQHRKN